MSFVERFLEEVTEELLYNIVYDKSVITPSKLRRKFKKKTGYEPLKFFGFGNKSRHRWSDFIKGIRGLEIIDFSDGEDIVSEKDDECIYTKFNAAYLDEAELSVAEYREKLLLQCCEIMKDDFSDLSSCKDGDGNTPLHILAALPGLTYNCNTLVKYVLRAGVDPLEANDKGQTFLHIVFGKFQAEFDDFEFGNERISNTEWLIDDHKALLKRLYAELSQAQFTALVKAQDEDGNTVLHECALSTTMQQKLIQDQSKIVRTLCKRGKGVILRIPNIHGEVPLHYASNPSVFKTFVQVEDAVCRVRNDRDETAVLFMTKQSVEFAFAKTSASAEVANLGFVEMKHDRNYGKAVELVKSLTSIVAENEEVRETIFLPDKKGNVAIEIVLMAIRIASYDLEVYVVKIIQSMTKLRSSLVKLLSSMLSKTDAADMKRQNSKGQNFLHVLLDMGDGKKHKIKQSKYILQSIEILLKHNVDVNAVDSKGCTPLDVIYKHCDKGLTLYQKYDKVLIENGAVANRYSKSDVSLVQGMSDLRIANEARKLRSCPKRHVYTAEHLTDSKSQVCVVGKYRYCSEDSIGSGAFSTIFVAIKDENVDNRSGVIECRAYALKRIEKAKINSQEIRREITTLLSISGSCENIIKYYDCVEDDFFQYLCLDLMDGDLDEFVENDDVDDLLQEDPALLAQVTKGIINGLAFLHEHNFIHRDLKPGNILYTTDPTLHFKIADFGLAKNISSLSTMTSTGGRGGAMVPGTRCWMAPELVSMKSRDHTQMSDIFSLGLVLHYLLTLGKHPFAKRSDEGPHVIERKIEEMQIHLDKTLHPEVVNFLQVLLARDPSKRSPIKYLHQHPFLWSENKKIEFLKAIGDQPEAFNPTNFPNSPLEKGLQNTNSGKEIKDVSWNRTIGSLYEEMIKAWKQKKYRTDKVIDLIRFIRNSYAHKQERSLQFQRDLDGNIFLRKFPSLVLDTFSVVQNLKLDEDPKRGNISQALKLSFA